jgi:RNA polymerase sigma-70 factor (ECF subfamily)
VYLSEVPSRPTRLDDPLNKQPARVKSSLVEQIPGRVSSKMVWLGGGDHELQSELQRAKEKWARWDHLSVENGQVEMALRRTWRRKALAVDEIEQVYRDRYGEFVRLATAITESTEAGRDAVNEAFVAALTRRNTYRGEGTVEAWLWRIVFRTALKLRRKSSFEGDGGRTAVGPAWSDRPYLDPTVVRAAITRLPERQRLVLFLRYYGGLDYRTIAEVTGVRIRTVGAELHAAHSFLKRELEEEPDVSASSRDR